MRKVMISILCILLMSCSTVSYKRWAPDGSAVEVSGWEIGTDKALAGLTYESKDITLGIESLDRNQSKGAEEGNKLIEHIIEGVIKGLKM